LIFRTNLESSYINGYDEADVIDVCPISVSEVYWHSPNGCPLLLGHNVHINDFLSQSNVSSSDKCHSNKNRKAATSSTHQLDNDKVNNL